MLIEVPPEKKKIPYFPADLVLPANVLGAKLAPYKLLKSNYCIKAWS